MAFWGEWKRTIGATHDLFGLIQRVSQSPKQYRGDSKLTVTQKDIVFDSVDFSYPSRANQSIFENLSLKVEAGKKTAVVGRSGSGKSTLVNLLLGCYPIKAGQIKLGTKPLEDYGFGSVIDAISVVEQEPVIFSGTISDNISFASIDEDISPEAIEDAARKANIHDFISGLPDGYQTVVGERGAQLSGGQKQRIAVARAFLRDTDILILDEPTSALDSESAALIRSALNELAKNKTTLVIAHSLSQIIDADKIIVLDKGKVVDEGEHEQLVQQSQGEYKKLFASELAVSEG